MFGENPDEISPHVLWHVYDFSALFLPNPILSNHMWVQVLELINLSSWTRVLYQRVLFWDLVSFMTMLQESLWEPEFKAGG